MSYMQDLNQLLGGDCLLPLADVDDAKLIDHSPLGSQNPTELAQNNFDALVSLSGDVHPQTHGEEVKGSAPSIHLWELHGPSPISTASPSPTPSTSTTSSSGNAKVETLMQRLDFLYKATDFKPTQPFQQPLQQPFQHSSNMAAVEGPDLVPPPPATTLQSTSLSPSLDFTTALPTRTADDATAEVRRILRVSQVPLRQQPSSFDSEGGYSATTTSSLGMNELEFEASTPRLAPVGEEEDEENHDEDESEDDEQVSSRPRKVTERKRRQNAIADRFLVERFEKSLKEELKVRPEVEAEQSARWLVNQSENRKIIGSPRDYQVELFERAKDRNIIAVLDTGTGKTLIAVLLLRHIIAQELEDRAVGKLPRISFFLVDSVQLVFQQHAVLKANLDQPMDMFCGEMNTDLWKREIWDKHFAKNMVIVCTAEVLRQCLHHSFISMDSINLLIFDEAHHAKKDHSYARIIKDFYVEQKKKGTAPKIFGMTASPVDARTDVRKAASDLESILDSQIATAAKDSTHSIQSKHSEQMSTYEPLGPRIETPLYKEMFSRFKSNPVLSKPLQFAYHASRELGTWCADEIWKISLTEQETKKLQAKTERKYLAKKIPEPLSSLEKRKQDIEEARAIVKSHTFDPPDHNPAMFKGANKELRCTPSKNLSTKVVLLINYLQSRFQRPTDDKCMVFVQQRYTALLLARLLSQPGIGTPYLKVDTLIGTKSGDPGEVSVTFREQVLTMAKFRRNDVNCLFSTSVGEEGLDIPDCNLIIRFDLCITLIQYIQSRGRARHVNSKFVHMVERNNADHQAMVREVKTNENILKKFCDQLPADRRLMDGEVNLDALLAKEKNRVYKTPTGARLDYKMSLAILSNFVDSLPRRPDVNLQVDYITTVQNKQFVCETILPEGSPVRGAIGRPANTKQVAKCSAAFETCLLLIQGKYLDDHLLGTFAKQLPALRNALLAVDEKKREAYDMQTKPSMWSNAAGVPDELFVTILELSNPEAMDQPCQPLALLTRAGLPELPSFHLHFGGDRHSLVQCIPLAQSIKVTSDVVQQINAFTLCVFEDVFSKGYQSDPGKMPYFLAPANTSGVISTNSDSSAIIAWDVIEAVADHSAKWAENPWDNKCWKTEPDEFFKDKFISDPYDGSRKMRTVGVAKQFKPLDPVPANTAPRKGTRKNNDNIMEYSCSLWAKARARRTFDPDQRVFEAHYVSLRRNLLDEFDNTQNDSSPTKCYIMLECLKVSPIPSAVVAMAYVFPAIIHRVESYLIALEACDLVHLKVRPDLALEAVTKDSDNSSEHNTDQVNFQRGMGKNYERLEFLGDCFLKMATSISLFCLLPDKDEFDYHCERMGMICNKNLKDNAIKLKLYEYVRSVSFNRRSWYPEGLVLLKGKTATAPNSHKLGDKSIADVCEALIGAALLTCHGQPTNRMDNAVRAVTEFVCNERHRVNCFADYYKLYKKPKYQISPATESHRNLAAQLASKHPYHFKYPRVARSAFIHPSYPFSYEHIPSYQRLEFLGDSLLDMACVNYLFHNYPDKDPQWLTEHKMAMVSNQFLGALCVHLGFNTHLLMMNPKDVARITQYVYEITEARRTAEEDAVRAGKSAKNCAPDYWIGVRQPPKCLPDVVEAYIGAIFVDSEYDYAEVEKFFDMHIKWYFADMHVYDTFANKHPTTFLTKFLQISMGCVDWSLVTKEVKHIDGRKPTVVAMVMIHDMVIADAEAESSRYAKVAAAKKAMAMLHGLPLLEFREKYGCDCTLEDVEKEENGSTPV